MSVDIVNRERFVLKEKQFRIVTSLMQQVKSENIEENNFVNNFENFQMESDRLVLKLENEDSIEIPHSHPRDGDSTVNDSFSLKIDSFSSHLTEETRQESLKEEICENNIISSPQSHRSSTYPQYLTNHSHYINIRNGDPFYFCLKGMQASEFELNSMNSLPISDFPKETPPYSKIVPTSQRFRDLRIVQTSTKKIKKGNKSVCSKSATKFANNDKLQLKNAKTVKQQNLPKLAKQKKHFICEVCSAQYLYELAFVNHISKHTAEFKCNDCAQSYTTQRALSLHMRVHRKYTSSTRQAKRLKHKITKRIH